ncbi:hypothetical protein CEXT_343911 [Caerostris extrusa]|uniref:Uncharacterized protein n=1 Tax=Caerostris extrusa TaxID=172846 RepID=A0AAV4XMP6_CAEEX|nr:hypothetical protein CEXT_343911 [Caerostris extrusa]
MENSAEWAYSISIAVKVSQIGLWFMSIVIVADCLQNRTSRTIDSMSYKMEKLKDSGIFYSNLDYKRMVKNELFNRLEHIHPSKKFVIYL